MKLNIGWFRRATKRSILNKNLAKRLTNGEQKCTMDDIFVRSVFEQKNFLSRKETTVHSQQEGKKYFLR